MIHPHRTLPPRQLSSARRPAALGLTAALLTLLPIACGGTQSSNEGAASPVGAGAACAAGETKMADDGCNRCSCRNGEWVCTLKACLQCPPPAEAGGSCASVVVYAKDPGSSMCCEYATPCSAPADWAQHSSQQECMGGESVPVE